MKTLVKHLSFLVFVLTSVFGCSKDSNKPNAPTGAGVIRPQGNAIGITQQLRVSPAGGSFQSQDGRLELVFPADAVSQTTTVELQSISNTNPAGLGTAYRLSAALTLLKPVRLKVSYESILDSLSGGTCGLGISLQDSSGIWQLLPGRTLNNDQRTIEVPISSFRDFTLMELIRVQADTSLVEPNGTVQLEAISNISFEAPYNDLTRFWEKFQAGRIPIHEDFPLPAELVERWSIAQGGEEAGSLSSTGSKATFKAAQSPNPTGNKTNILLSVRGTSCPFRSEIEHLSGPGSLQIQIGDKSYTYMDEQVYASVNNANELSIVWESGQGWGGLHAQSGQPGTYLWAHSSLKNDFWFEPKDILPLSVFQHLINDGRDPSPGFIQVIRSGSVGQAIVGSFILNPAGRTNMESGNGIYIGEARITGSFNLRRDD